MSGIKRKIEDNDPDYEDILLAQNSKRNKVEEHNGKPGCSELWQFTCPTCNDVWNTRVPTVIPTLVDLHFITLFFTAREATVRKIETIIRQQFSLEMKNKEHEIDVISQV